MADSDGKRYYWLRLKKDFFHQHQIKVLKSLPNGRLYALIYLELMAESTSHEGQLRYSKLLPYDIVTLSAVIDEDKDNVEKAIETLCNLELVEILDDGTIFLCDLQKLIGSETGSAERKRSLKRRKNLDVDPKSLPVSFPYRLGNCYVQSDSMINLPNGKTQFVDEKRYGGNGKWVLARSDGKCEVCGSDENLMIHHMNGYSNDVNDLIVVCSKCHGKIHSGKISPKIPLENRDKSKSIEYRDKTIDDDEKIIGRFIEAGYDECDVDRAVSILKRFKASLTSENISKAIDICQCESIANPEGYIREMLRKETNEQS